MLWAWSILVRFLDRIVFPVSLARVLNALIPTMVSVRPVLASFFTSTLADPSLP